MHQIVASRSLKRETLISIFIYMPGIKLISAVVEASLSNKREILINILRYTYWEALSVQTLLLGIFYRKGILINILGYIMVQNLISASFVTKKNKEGAVCFSHIRIHTGENIFLFPKFWVKLMLAAIVVLSFFTKGSLWEAPYDTHMWETLSVLPLWKSIFHFINTISL